MTYRQYKIRTLVLSVVAVGLIIGSAFVFQKPKGAASHSYYESLKIANASLNGNSIWGGGEAYSSVVSAGGLDQWAAFYSANRKASGGLDPSGALSLDGIPFQMSWTGAGDYNGNDTIRLYSEHTSTRVTLETVGAYDKLYVLGTAGGPGEGNYANFAVRVNYTDGSVDETSYRLYDWYDATPVSGVYKWPNLARRLVVSSDSSGRYGSQTENYNYEGTTTGAPYLQSATIKVDAKKLVASIDLVLTGKNGSSDTAGIYCGIYAITGMVNVSAPNPVETVYVSGVTETTAHIYWDAVERATSYRLDIALDPDFQNILPAYNNRLVSDTMLDAEGLSGDTLYYTRVRAENSEGQSISSNVATFRTDAETIPPVVTLDGRPTLIQISDQLVVTATDLSGIRNIEQSLDGGSTWAVVIESDRFERTITENATYCYRATDNYGNVSDASCLTYINLDTEKPVIRVNTNGYVEGSWTNQVITLTVESLTANVGVTSYYYSTDGETWLPYDGGVTYNGETSTDGIRYYFKAISQAGIESEVVSVLLKKDNTAPTGTISSAQNSWNSFLNTITFGLFFNNTMEFSISAEDTLSGVASVEYLITNQSLGSVEEASAQSGWRSLPDQAISIDPEGDFVLYYRLTDAAGNVSVINTNGLILDTTEALIRGYVDAEHTYPLESGKTYYLTQKIIVTDDRALDVVEINGNPVTLPDSNVIELHGNQDNTYTIEAYDKAGNLTTVVINVAALSNLNLDITEDNYKTSDTAALEAVQAKLAAIEASEGDHATEDERIILDELEARYESLLEIIAALEDELADEASRGEAIPDVSHVTSDYRDTIVELISDIVDTLTEDPTHLTTDELNSLLEEKRELEEKLARLDEVAEHIEHLEILDYTDTGVIQPSDQAELLELLAEAEALLATDNLTTDERERVEDWVDKINELLSRIDEILEEERLAEEERQRWEEIQRTTFPELSVVAETEHWIPFDIVGLTASDEYGVTSLAVSSDNGASWQSLTALDSTTFTVTENGTYLFRATNTFDNTTTKTVTYHNIDPTQPVVAVDSHGYTLGSWTNQPVLLSAENTAANLSPVSLYVREQGTEEWLDYTTAIISSEDTNSQVYEFKAVSAAGLTSDVVVAEVKKDSVVPTGEISISNDSVAEVLHTLTLGLFFKDTKRYDLSASDDRSGVKTVSYVVSDVALSESELRETYLWHEGNGSVAVDPEAPVFVYYRVVDQAGNISVISQDGAIFELPGLADVDVELTAGADHYSTLITGSGTISLLDDLEHRTADDLSALSNDQAKLEEYLSSHDDGLVSSLLEDYAAAIAEITEVETRVDNVEAEAANLPAVTTSDDKEGIAALATEIESLLAPGNHLTDTERSDLETLLDALTGRLTEIAETQAQLGDLEARTDSYDISTVNKTDLEDLEDLKSEIEDLLENGHLTDGERSDLEDLLETIAELEARIEEAEKAIEDAKEHDPVPGVNPDNVQPGDQSGLEDAYQGYTEALGVFDTNLSLSDLLDATNRLTTIGSALDLLDQVAEFEGLVSRLPNPNEVSFAYRDAINAAQLAYNELSEYGRTLVGPSLMAKYKAVIEAYRAFLEGSPILYAFETLDVFWWGLTTFFIVGSFILVTRRTHRRYVEDAADDDF